MEQDFENSFHRGIAKGFGFGLVLILIGIVFLLFNFNLLPVQLKWVIISWPSLMIVLGLIKFFKRQYVPSTLLFLIGIFFLIPRIMNAFPEIFPNNIGNFTHTFWPLLLIVAGGVLILGKLYPAQFGNFTYNYHPKRRYHKYHNGNKGFEKNSIFGSGEHIVLEPEFEGGELNAVFGSVTIDLRRTALKEGITHLEVNAVFGSVTIFVPDNWLVETNVDAVFGGFDDQRRQHETIDMSKRLVITGACVFGGTELRN